jgi:serpin B
MMPLHITTRLLILVTLGLLTFSLLGGAGDRPTRSTGEAGREAEIGARRFSPNSVSLDSVSHAYVGSANRFGFGLLRSVTESQPGQNAVLSPASAAIVLLMVYNGASGDTKQAMAEVLEVHGLSVEDINHANQVLSDLLREPGVGVQLNLANSLWLKDDFAFRQEFLDNNAAAYQAEIAALDFGDPGTVERINRWCAEATNERIQRVFQSIAPEAVMIRITALYFKGDWTAPFGEKATEVRDYFLADSTAIRHLLMQRRDKFQYFERDGLQAVRLPYGDERLEMQVYLPSADLGMTGFLAQLNETGWQEMQDSFRRREGTVLLPKFKLEFETDLSEPLKLMGMAVAFDRRQADFSGLAELTGDSVLFIQQVKQKTFLEVNEKGTEAAAVTAVTMALATSVMPEEPFRMEINRPFFVSIVDRATGLRLFDAVIVDPRG